MFLSKIGSDSRRGCHDRKVGFHWVGLKDVVHHFMGINQIVDRNEVKATLHITPKGPFGKELEGENEQNNE